SMTSRPRSSRRGKRKTPFRCNGANASDKLAPLPRRSSARAGEGADAADHDEDAVAAESWSGRLGLLPLPGWGGEGGELAKAGEPGESRRYASLPVTRGLDPRVHPLRKNSFANRMDCRVEPGNDDRGELVA